MFIHTNIKQTGFTALNTQALKSNTKLLSAVQKQLAHKRFHGGTGGNMMGGTTFIQT